MKELLKMKYWDQFSDEELEQLWDLFGDVPINDRDEIECSFIGFEEETNRFEIWDWFDRHYSKGVMELSYKE